MESFSHLSVTDASAIMKRAETVVVDIRDTESFKQGHITGAKRLDNENLADFLRDTDYDSPVIVCCYHGNSSQSAAQFLVEQGFEEVYSLDGGFTEWSTTHPDQVARLAG